MRLTHSLEVTLRKIAPHEMDLEFGRELGSGRCPIEGMSGLRLVRDIGELRDKGMLKAEKGEPLVFTLTTEGRDYFWNRRRKVVKKIVRSLFQLLCGAAGGAVVWVLGHFLG